MRKHNIVSWKLLFSWHINSWELRMWMSPKWKRSCLGLISSCFYKQLYFEAVTVAFCGWACLYISSASPSQWVLLLPQDASTNIHSSPSSISSFPLNMKRSNHTCTLHNCASHGSSLLCPSATHHFEPSTALCPVLQLMSLSSKTVKSWVSCSSVSTAGNTGVWKYGAQQQPLKRPSGHSYFATIFVIYTWGRKRWIGSSS